ncbi:iron ABC transporter substrate-binding protein [Ureaplasma parvum]|uniref:iron ABC transporter substrate-binding protein n=1 Tax=Ureaplasma parvum TaxID=134821 RepID=UPI0026EC38AC|nr:iron ABC transporter substrate-binding protein [Ureaplasma parvum]
MKYKKIWITSITSIAFITTIVSTTTACSKVNNEVKSSNDIFKQISPTKEELTNLIKRRKDWANDLQVYFEGGKSASGKEFERIQTLATNASTYYQKNQKIAMTRDSGSLCQDDAAYSFGIAPDISNYHWKAADVEEVVPHYLSYLYNPKLTKGMELKNVKAETLAAENVGTLFIADFKFGNYKTNFLDKNKIGGIIMQSRSSGLPSKAPALFMPNWLFGKNNPYLETDVNASAGITDFFVDPYDGLIFTGKTLDRIYDAKKFDNVNKAVIDGKSDFRTFTDYAKAIVNVVRKNVLNWAKQHSYWKNKTVVMTMPNVMKGARIIDPNFSKDDLLFLSNIFIPQPVYFPILYADQNDEYTPGLGAKFPIPKKNINQVQRYVDNWGWIGGAILSDAANPDAAKRVGSTLGEAFEGTVDKVIYSYNEYLIKGYKPGTAEGEAVIKKFEANLAKYINSLDINTKNSFNPTRILKEKPVVGKNFFIERKGNIYDANYGFIGQKTVVNILNRWMNGENSPEVDLGIPNFTKDNVKHLRAFKDELNVKNIDE